MNVTIVPARSEHIPALVAGMSPTIRKEVGDMSPNLTLEEAVQSCFDRSSEAYVAFADDKLVCSLGISVAHILSDVGRPWMIPHNVHINTYKFAFLKASKAWIEEMLTRYTKLEAIGRHTRAQKWLKWLGFRPVRGVRINGFKYFVLKGIQ